ncbi:zinc finger protein-related [Abeliophyllum distichum]|uniref:Zinc finger protein-related n=1 Tax=Abeliophyllum distichum TaxID=126358 RepID=A0ABD1PTF7_9LAMI
MPAVWFALKRSLQCKSEPLDVYDPKGNGNLSHILTRKSGSSGRSGCSRSIANLKDVIHGSKRHTEKPQICSPRSIGSSELLNPITHEVVLSNSTCELKITAGYGFQEVGVGGGSGGDGGSTFVGTLKPWTPGPGRLKGNKPRGLASPIRRTSSSLSRRTSGFGVIPTRPRTSFGADSNGALFCHKCREQFGKWEAVEEHHLSKHAVTELVEGESSRKIVEIICRTSCTKPDSNCGGIERILKVHNMQKTLAQFEEYRELVKIKASKLPKKHPRCLADGNELLRFYGATVECNLGINGSSSLCTLDKCRVCRILRHGFSSKKGLNGGSVGVFTASTSGRAFESLQVYDDNPRIRKALVVCRVIAGRVHRPLENVQELAGQSGFDSLAGKLGVHSNIEELYLLSPRALLPCFVVIYKP